MSVRCYRDLIAWQMAEAFKIEVYRLLEADVGGACRDARYRSQLLSAAEGVAANIVEGFARFSAADFARFLDYALGSLTEAEQRLDDGIRRRCFTPEACAPAFRLGRRCLTAMVRLKQSQQPSRSRSASSAPVAPVAPEDPVVPRKR